MMVVLGWCADSRSGEAIPMPNKRDAELISLMRAISAGDTATISGLLGESPALARAQLEHGATREDP
jgi:hypothetical protein